jgi:hypothetical protein
LRWLKRIENHYEGATHVLQEASSSTSPFAHVATATSVSSAADHGSVDHGRLLWSDEADSDSAPLP